MTFQARIRTRQGDLGAALQLIRSAAESIEDRFPISWIKLRTEELRLLGKTGRPVLDQVVGLLRKIAMDRG